MRNQSKTLLSIACILFASQLHAQSLKPLAIKDSMYSVPLNNVEIKGYFGNKIDLSIKNSVKKVDPDYVINPFKERKETFFWQTEFWGKWILSAISAYEYKGDPELKKSIDYAVKGLIATQSPNGYIGNYPDSAHLKNWDVWGRKYSLLGLLHYYDLAGDKAALNAARKLADHLFTEVGPGKTSIVMTGWFMGMPSSSILEPMVMLYNRTGEARYLDFAKYIVKQWETPEGPQLISKALNGVPVSERFPRPKSWWTRENGFKAYEMMSCYDGLLELYKVTGNPEYLKAVEMTAKNIIDTEINIAGSGAAFECWYHGKERQTHPAYHTMETCVTQTWMKLCSNLLKITGNPMYADQIELSAFNALLSSMLPDGSTFTKYSPLEGFRSLGEGQCNMQINCCIANGPRAFLLFPTLAMMPGKNGIYINLYAPSKETFTMGKSKVMIEQVTNYPVSDSVVVMVNPEVSSIFTIALRIPAWSAETKVFINGKAIESITAGSYAKISRIWNKGDKVTLNLDMRGRLITNGLFKAIMWGPVVLARDSRLSKESPDEAVAPDAKNGFIQLKDNSANQPKEVWMSFTAPLVLGTNLEGNKGPVQIPFVDYASAGNNWDNSSRFRVWLPEAVDISVNKP
jgi:DUF1680 family protein